MSIYMEYLDDSEREFCINDTKINNEINKIFTLLEMCEMKYDQMCLDAELKVLSESGTYDDLTYLYQEAEEEKSEEEKGLISRLFSSIAEFFKNIWSSLFGKSNVPDDKEIEVHKGTRECCNKIIEFFKNPGVAIGTIATGAGAITLAIQNGTEKVKAGEAKSWISQIMDSITGVINTLKNGASSILAPIKQFFGDKFSDNEIYKKFKGVIDSITTFVKKKIYEPIKDKLGAAGYAIGGLADKAKNLFDSQEEKERKKSAAEGEKVWHDSASHMMYYKTADGKYQKAKVEVDPNTKKETTTIGSRIDIADEKEIVNLPKEAQRALGFDYNAYKDNKQAAKNANNNQQQPAQTGGKAVQQDGVKWVLSSDKKSVTKYEQLSNGQFGQGINVPLTSIPDNIKKSLGIPTQPAQPAQPTNTGNTQTATQQQPAQTGQNINASVEELAISLGSNYVLEAFEDGSIGIEFIGENADDDIFNDISFISTSKSIFGSDYDELMESTSYDDGMHELADIFDDLF